MEPFKKKYRPLRELGFITIIYMLVIIFLWECSVVKNIYAILGIFGFYFFTYALPTLIIFNNYNNYILRRDKDYYNIEEKEVIKLVFVGTEDKIKDRPSVYSLPYHMNFFYIKIYIMSDEKPILVTSLDEYKVEEWAKTKFPNIEIEKEIDFFPTIRE